MSETDTQAIVKALSMLSRVLPSSKNRELTQDDIDAYVFILSRYPTEAAVNAVLSFMTDNNGSEFFPSGPAIAARIAERATNLPSPAAAWGMVLDRLKQPVGAGEWRAPQPVKDAVRQIGGISELRRSEMPQADQKRFLDAYAALRQEAVTEVQTTGVLPLPEPERKRTLSPTGWSGVFSSHPEEWPTDPEANVLPSRLLALPTKEAQS